MSTHEDTLIANYRESATMKSALEIAREAWSFCPECGCFDWKPTGWGEGRFCVGCGQEWFPDIDYTNVVARNLAKLTQQAARALPHPTIKESTAQAVEPVALSDDMRAKAAAMREELQRIKRRPQDAEEHAIKSAILDGMSDPIYWADDVALMNGYGVQQFTNGFRAALSAPVPQASGQQEWQQTYNDLRHLIADDSYAMSFQTMGQYRSALLKKGGGNV